jgi:hypothetical protein
MENLMGFQGCIFLLHSKNVVKKLFSLAKRFRESPIRWVRLAFGFEN